MKIVKRYEGIDYLIQNQTEWFALLQRYPDFDREATLVKDLTGGRRW